MAEDRTRGSDRVFLVVVDESEELNAALRFACRRVSRVGGRVALLYVVEPGDFGHWAAVKDLMEEEGRTMAEERLKNLSAQVQAWTGETPILYIREGTRRTQLLELLEEEPRISVLVLGAASGRGGPGPLVSALTSKRYSSRLRVPMTIVPGSLTEAEIDALT